MNKRSLSVAVLAMRKTLEKKIFPALPSKRKCKVFTSVGNLFPINDFDLLIIEHTDTIKISTILKLIRKNKSIQVVFILKEHNLRVESQIIKHERCDFLIDGKALTGQLKKKVSAIAALQKLENEISRCKNEIQQSNLDFVDNLIIGLYRTTPDGKIMLLNKTALKIVGCKSLKEVQKINLEDEYYDPYHLRRLFKQQLIEKGEVIDFENRWRRPDGKMIVVRENARAVKDKKGNILYYEGTFEDMTQRVEIEKALIESEKKLHLTLETANIGIWNWSIKTNEIFFSREFSNMLGYSADEIDTTIDSFINLFHKEDRHIILNSLFSGVTEDHPDFETEIRMNHKLGDVRWMFTKGKVIEWSGNIPLNIIAIQIDITDRKLAEAKIIESETRFRELAENIEEIFWLLNEKEILYISPGLEKFTGMYIERYDKIVSTLYRTVHKEDRRRVKRSIELEVKNGPGVFNEEFRIVRPDGIEKWFWARTFPVKKGNKPYRSVGIAEDITERKKLQLELERFKNQLQETVDKRTAELMGLNQRLVDEIEKQKKAEEEIENQLKFFRTLIETAASPMFIKDADKKYLDCNRAFEEYFDESRSKIIGKSDSELFPYEIASRFESIDDELLLNPGELTYEGATKHEGANRKEFMISKSTFLKADGKPGGIIAFVTDITQRKKLELSIQKAFDKEKELLDIKSKLISTASHEFRTPLTTILSSIDLIDIYRKKGNEEKYYIHSDKIKSSVKYMIELLNDVMIINRAESGKLEFSPGELDIVELCREIISEIRQVIAKDVKVDFIFPDTAGLVYADKKLLKLIISNLLNNAVKYSRENGKVFFTLSLNGVIDFKIADNGVGIPQEEFPMIFEPFHRGQNVEEKPGTGLGLSIVKRCVDLHKGKISFESSLNGGTVFYVQIPINYKI